MDDSSNSGGADYDAYIDKINQIKSLITAIGFNIFNTKSEEKANRVLPSKAYMLSMVVFVMTNIVAGVIGSRLLDIINNTLKVF